MAYAIAGIVVAVTQCWRLASGAFDGTYAFPQLVRLGAPAILLAGVFTRPSHERAAVVSLSTLFFLILNRDLTGHSWFVFGLTLLASVVLTFEGFRLSRTTGLAKDTKRLMWAMVLTMVGLTLGLVASGLR